MRILAPKKIYLYSLTLIALASKMNAQDQNISVNQDPKFEQLLNEKRKINTSLTVNDSYKIQIYSGGSEIAKKTLNEFKQEFKDIDATIIFNTPNYKVWVGSFKTRIEAERNMANIKNKYKNILLIKPNK
ncbi:MAG: SPOR domain-containing protein [Bacteroidota bacterium]